MERHNGTVWYDMERYTMGCDMGRNAVRHVIWYNKPGTRYGTRDTEMCGQTRADRPIYAAWFDTVRYQTGHCMIWCGTAVHYGNTHADRPNNTVRYGTGRWSVPRMMRFGTIRRYTRYGTVRYTEVRPTQAYQTILCGTIWCDTVWYGVTYVRYDTERYGEVTLQKEYQVCNMCGRNSQTEKSSIEQDDNEELAGVILK